MYDRKKAIKSMYLFACLTVIFNLLDQNIIGIACFKATFNGMSVLSVEKSQIFCK
jgi:hypothetical protein